MKVVASSSSARLRVVIAPDSFKGTASATQVAAALAAGWLDARPGDDVVQLPMADGGEGTLEALAQALAAADQPTEESAGARVAEWMPIVVTGPDDRAVSTRWLRLGEPDGSTTGIVELACTSGITLLDVLRPDTAHTRGFGQAVAAALDAGVDRLLLAIGGSSSTDGGVGMLRELGAEFFDADGVPVPDGAVGVMATVRASLQPLRRPPSGGVAVLTDVTNPLVGELGAAAVFGPQKGVSPDRIAEFDAALRGFARVCGDSIDPLTPGAGAAGGVGFGALVWGAHLVNGSAAVAREIGLDRIVAGADLVITGEGRFDGQSAHGKAPAHVSAIASAAGAVVALVAGSIDDDADTGPFAEHLALADLAGSGAAAMADTTVWLREAGRALAQRLSRRDAPAR